jgi:ATP-dependent helicase/nuclease subunit A
VTAPSEASLRQHAAADPGGSVWVMANAGSGKTRVLTERVARLLLAGAAPERILCLTYTRAAAAEMQNRLTALLGGWTMLPDAALARALAEIGVEEPADAARLAAARRLFARAIDAPGGLRILTIHAFAAQILRRFPLEAGVTPDFAELDDRAMRLLLSDTLDALAAGPEAELVGAFAAQAGGEDLGRLLREIADHRAGFAEPLDRTGAAARLGVDPDLDAPTLLGRVFLGGERAMIDAVLAALPPNAHGAKGALAALSGVGPLDPPTLDDLARLEAAVLTGGSANKPFTAKTADLGGHAFPKPSVRAQMGDRLAGWDAFLRRVEAARPLRLGLLALQRTLVLHRFAAAFLSAYRERKQALNRLDFDDLILTAEKLLHEPGVADWVLFRLDGGIDHILVDEAQDTSPRQWQIIRCLAEEFTAGASARSDRPRTLFVVGDLKQSIYSFQGADPAQFTQMADHFEARARAAGAPFRRADLLHSFRSAPAILRAVDHVFSRPETNRGLGGPPTHVAFHADRPGRVDLWPALPAAPRADDPAWTDASFRTGGHNPDSQLARLIAAEVRRLCDPESGETLPLPPAEPGGPPRRRPIEPGDVMILVQRRSTVFAPLIRALKAEGVPVAGADVLRLGAELAVRDIAAVLSVLATPEDDLSLAAALRSPLFGWSEGELYRLAQPRPEGASLWQALRQAGPSPALAVLTDLRDRADFLRPYELIERLLLRHDGRRKLLARLGPEAEEGIDALITQALAYEGQGVPSLTGFLGYLETGEIEVKRQLAGTRGMVRVMTVHGAKGLESPIVILPDTRAAAAQDRARTIADDDGVRLWRGSSAEGRPARLEALVAARAGRLADERMRLLYVAMTRAENWLIVAGAKDDGSEPDSWHAILTEAFRGLPAAPIATPAGEGLRLSTGADWGAGAVERPLAAAAASVAPPGWASAPAPAPAPAPRPVAPTDLGGDKVLPGAGGEPADGGAEEGGGDAAATRRGRLLHRLLEHLPAAPPGRRRALAEALLAADPNPPPPGEADAVLATVLRLMDDPQTAALLARPALAEVEITAELPELGGRRILGAIDRLIVAPDRVLALDYKTNRRIPDAPEAVPEGILRQMGAYAAALARVYPGRIVETAILWTAGPLLMPLPGPLVAAALRRAGAS